MTLLTWQADHFPSLLVSLFCLFCCFGFVLPCAFSVFVEIVTASWTMYRSMPADLLWLPMAYVNASIRQFSLLQHVIERVNDLAKAKRRWRKKNRLTLSQVTTRLMLPPNFSIRHVKNSLVSQMYHLRESLTLRLARQLRHLSCILDSCTIAASYEVSQAQKALLLMPRTAKGASTSSGELNAQVSLPTDDEYHAFQD